MSDEFLMPSLGADMDDGVITEWRVAPGDVVSRGQIIVVVETDKSDIEVEIFQPAIIDELLVAEGQRVAVGTPIARLRADEPGAEPGTAPALGAPVDVPPDVPVDVPVDAPVDVPVDAPVDVPVAVTVEPGAQPHHIDHPTVTSPLVRHLAERLHVDTADIAGSGPGGRIRRDDVEAAARPEPRRRITPRARRLAADAGLHLDRLPPGSTVVTGDDLAAVISSDRSPSEARTDPTRRTVAALMERSWAEIPHFHVGRRLDMSSALYRLSEINAGRPVAQRVLPIAVLLHAVARAAVDVGAVNGWWRNGRFDGAVGVDLGVIVARRGGGIIAPRLVAVERMSVDEVMVALVDLVGRARAGRLRSGDVGEASITVSNLGDLGADYVHGVIHPPQVALVGFGAIHDEAVIVDGEPVARPVVHATLAGDHRAIDGLVGATFLERVGRHIIDSALSIPSVRVAVGDRPG